jgi:hypothetical protein
MSVNVPFRTPAVECQSWSVAVAAGVVRSSVEVARSSAAAVAAAARSAAS